MKNRRSDKTQDEVLAKVQLRMKRKTFQIGLNFLFEFIYSELVY